MSIYVHIYGKQCAVTLIKCMQHSKDRLGTETIAALLQNRAVVKSTFVESKTSPSPKRFESESSPSPKRFESESSPSPKRFESKSKSK